MNKIEVLLSNVDAYFKEHPSHFGWLFIVLGIVLFIGSLKRWNWVYEDKPGTIWGTQWIIETFGFKTAQVLKILFSLLFIGLGIIWLLFY
ncbi:Imm17 family immunity protein [Flavobacterium foetidum]|uniref:Imm17 family immunity protein n=1 Tax=Flavobacterium foetidum TaxID=2026681 RepID=UPI001074D83B|nr:Imm17 family immunity protein [Flavobacterium foetidum]KAF2514695.1 hypothetical protein E0W73_12145 [Flavobacterium foetidum]